MNVPRIHGSGVFSRERYTGSAQAQHGASHDEDSSPCFRHPDPQCSRPAPALCLRFCCPGLMLSCAGPRKAFSPAGNAAFSARLSALCASAASFPSVPRSRPAERVPCRRLRDAAPSRRPPGGGLRRMTSDRGKKAGERLLSAETGAGTLRAASADVPLPPPDPAACSSTPGMPPGGLFAWNAFFCRNGKRLPRHDPSTSPRHPSSSPLLPLRLVLSTPAPHLSAAGSPPLLPHAKKAADNVSFRLSSLYEMRFFPYI